MTSVLVGMNLLTSTGSSPPFFPSDLMNHLNITTTPPLQSPLLLSKYPVPYGFQDRRKCPLQDEYDRSQRKLARLSRRFEELQSACTLAAETGETIEDLCGPLVVDRDAIKKMRKEKKKKKNSKHRKNPPKKPLGIQEGVCGNGKLGRCQDPSHCCSVWGYCGAGNHCNSKTCHSGPCVEKEDDREVPPESKSPSSSSSDSKSTSGPSRGDAFVRGGSEVAKMTVYSYQSNTPCNSASKACYWRDDLRLIPFVSVAVPSRLFAQSETRGDRTSSYPSNGLTFGDVLFLSHLKGRSMPNGKIHTGFVQITDICGDDHNQDYCFTNEGHVKLDLYVGDWTKISTSGCSNPSGSGLDDTIVRRATREEIATQLIKDYGGEALGSGSCGDCGVAQQQMTACWHYTPPASTKQWCPSLVSKGVAKP